MMDVAKQIRLTDERIRTNPVLSFEDWIAEYFPVHNPSSGRRIADQKLAEWIDAGVGIPIHAVERFRSRGWLSHSSRSGGESTPRITGLVFDRDRNVGLVDPLVTKRAAALTHSTLLPFSAQAAQSLLLRVCDKLLPQIPGAVPESIGFDFSESLHENCIGNSMDVAALLSCFDAITEQECELLSAACAVVELGRDDALVPVRHLREKVEAFVREYGRGSLLVISPDSHVNESLFAAFKTVWMVDSIEGLAARIGQLPNVMAVLQAAAPLRSEQLGLVLSRLRSLEEQRNSVEVLRLCKRIAECGFNDDVVLYERTRIQKYHADALRHLGRYRESLIVAAELGSLLEECKTLFSSDELMGHAVDRAAALFDSCSFREAYHQLESWLDMCKQDPQRFSCQKRIELFNTIGRCMIMLQIEGWQQLFEDSIQLQKQIDPASIRRTESYLCHGLLRVNQLESADDIIRRHESSMTAEPFVDGFTRFYRCELERRRGAIWPANLDELPQWKDGLPTWTHYVYAFALQAIGRQLNRPSEQRASLLSQAEQHLRPLCGGDGNVLNLIAHAILLAQSAISHDVDLWSATVDGLRLHLSTLGEAQTVWFGIITKEMSTEPDLEVAEKLIRLVPYL